ncbi:MAG TPA: secretin N-terminal domain-containing protein [Burkholderiales bacterium]
MLKVFTHLAAAGSVVALLLCPPLARAELEVITLRHRTVDQVLPVLHPLLAPGGTLSGQYGQLIVRTTPANLAELRKVLEAIDQPQRRLTILVRFDAAGESERSGVGADVRVRAGGPGADARVEVRAQEVRSGFDERVDQRIAVLEGSRAFISTGESRPVEQQQIVQTPTGTIVTRNTAVQSARTGFDVVPRVAGDTVTLEIAPRRDTFSEPTASGNASPVHSQGVSTTVSGCLGEWIELGASGATVARSSSGFVSSSQARASKNRRIWVRVDEARH